MVERTEVVCLNCGKRWLGKADSKRWKCTQCGSTRIKPVEALKELAEGGKDITEEVETRKQGESHGEKQPEKSAGKDVRDGKADEKETSHNEKKKEESEEKQENGRIGLSWLLLIPLIIIAGFMFLRSLWNREEERKEPEQEHPTNPFGRRPF